MSDETTLLPCPFCGGKTTTFLDDDGKWHIWTRCHGDAMHHAFVIADTEAEAIAAWNTRVKLGSEREKRLEKLVRSLYADYYSEWPDRAGEAYAERMKELGIEVIDE